MNENGSRGGFKTRTYYTGYVNHMIWFYLSTPESLRLEGKKSCDAENWIAVQGVFRRLKDDERAKLERIYRHSHNVPASVRAYCEETGEEERRVWVLITRTAALIARSRGLV